MRLDHRPAGAGTLFTFGPDPRNKPTAKAIVEKFKANSIDPEGYTLYTYAAIQVWSQAAKKAGTTDPKKVMAAIKAGAWDTVIGNRSKSTPRATSSSSTMSSTNGTTKAATPRSIRRGREARSISPPCQAPRFAGAFLYDVRRPGNMR